ncbi:hypothetical protein GCM10011414_13790 [Croceivirga lutea]|uniref:SIR2 family protein n=1 Tax=Croceivirga lutea TaxID=1775167 RepID=UPI00163B6118|nr:SIR2 family protein [Croceivirga lutea]GGG45479.1 hypothetical protein GCM10011414_13790 [Croceivirga lutea]
MSSQKFPQHLLEAIAGNKLIVFAGSGTSHNLKFPSWNELVIQIIDSIVTSTGDKKLNAFKGVLETGAMEAIDVLTQIEKQGYRKNSFDYLEKNLRIASNEDLSLQNELFELCPKIITTNYDHAFEHALGDKVHKIGYESIHGMTNLSKKSNYIFKIHGDIDNPDKCILFQSDYNKLYKENQENLFLTRLRSLILDRTILFIGFSLSDPYVKEVFSKMNELTGGMMDKHYLITTQEDFSLPFIEPIVLESYAHVLETIKALKVITDSKVESGDISKTQVELNDVDSTNKASETKTTLLFADPIDKNFDFKPEISFKSIGNYQALFQQSILNMDKLRNVENGYLFLFTQTIKGSLVIEDEYLCSRQISHEDLMDNISENISGVFVFTNKLPNFKESSTGRIPCSYLIEENSSKQKKRIDSLLYKISRGREDFYKDSNQIFNDAQFEVLSLVKGKVTNVSAEHSLSRYIDKKLLSHFIGRKTDVENIIRKVIDLEFEDKILTIKGSGGIGKTTIIIKAAIELAKRELFNSIEYISCQSISSLENLKYQISNCLGLDSSSDLISQLHALGKEKNTIIILDNFETLLSLPESLEMLEIVSVVCDYCLVVTTSRQLLDLEFEELYELRRLTTEEGLELFTTYYKGKLDEEEQRILRYDIVEELLNNNPLAIKIVSKGVPHSKSMRILCDELKENIFSNENLDRIFEKPEDINIEKSKSLYYSIKYSYDKLNPQEKLSFELLSLFPDGIHVENLKKFAKQNKTSPIKITDKEIKSLNDKSLLENSSGFLKLQSIVNRFSNHQFNLKDKVVKRSFYTLCFEYNYFFIDFLQNYLKISDSLQAQDDNINNYLRCIDYMEFINKKDEEKLDYIDCLANFFRNINQHTEFTIKLNKIEHLFSENENGVKLIKLIKLHLLFWCKRFSGVSNEVKGLITKQEIQLLDLEDKVEKMIYGKAMSINTCEGDSLFLVEDYIKRKYLQPNIINEIYRVGFKKIALELIEYESDPDFGNYEIMLANDCLSEDDLVNYLKRLYKKETLELIQTTYTRLKLNPKIEIDTSSFVVTNPYTQGMVYLIKAIKETDIDLKNKHFLNALNHLQHIRYYYVEAIFQYCSFLKMAGKTKDFTKYLEIGLKQSTKFSFYYLKHKFLKFEDSSLKYDENEIFQKLPQLKKDEIENYVKEFKQKQKGKKRK